MLKLFKYTCGLDEKFGAATDEQDAYDRRAEVDPTFDFVGVRIEEVNVQGFVITVTPEAEEVAVVSGEPNAIVIDPELELEPEPEPVVEPDAAGNTFENMDRAALVEWLKANGVHYVPQWGDARLRETAQAAAKELNTDGE